MAHTIKAYLSEPMNERQRRIPLTATGVNLYLVADVATAEAARILADVEPAPVQSASGAKAWHRFDPKAWSMPGSFHDTAREAFVGALASFISDEAGL